MKGVRGMRKLGKILVSIASIAAVIGGAYYFVKKVLLDDSYDDFDEFDEDFDDDFDEEFDDFDEDEDDFIPVNMEEVQPEQDMTNTNETEEEISED